ncbi:MAG: hypothetical protein WKF46_08495 [Candidatus Limnocylindrales bacterium]
MPSEGAVYTAWIVSLLLGVVVILVVALLLAAILRTVRQIDAAVAQIWVVGQRIANNTVHIPLLHETNRVAGLILERAGGIDGAAAQIEQHSGVCPSCPRCALAPGGVVR